MILLVVFSFFFFFNDTATTEIYTLSLHDALPISIAIVRRNVRPARIKPGLPDRPGVALRSEEHTSELQSHVNLVCRLLLEKKKKKKKKNTHHLKNTNITNLNTKRKNSEH